MVDDTEFRDLKEEVAKLRYHLRLLMEDAQLKRGSYAALAIEFDWAAEDISRMLDIFEACDHAKDTTGLESSLKSQFGISYQAVKSIVLTLWENGQFSWVCQDYAAKHRCAEFDHSGMYKWP